VLTKEVVFEFVFVVLPCVEVIPKDTERAAQKERASDMIF
jgi:hypothetical protein